MAGVKSVERRPCAICRRTTLHVVTKSKNGMGETLAEDADCRDHDEWSTGRIDVLDPRTREWRMLRPPDEKTRRRDQNVGPSKR